MTQNQQYFRHNMLQLEKSRIEEVLEILKSNFKLTQYFDDEYSSRLIYTSLKKKKYDKLTFNYLKKAMLLFGASHIKSRTGIVSYHGIKCTTDLLNANEIE